MRQIHLSHIQIVYTLEIFEGFIEFPFPQR